jgi:serine/threonine-protein kinase
MLEAGAQIGAYTIIRRLGAGGMGEVYLGKHRHIGRDAAIKLLLPELSRNEEVVARFFNEARATAAIRHPGIVEIIDCDVHPSGRAYIVMEYLEGENLATCLARVGSFSSDMRTVGSITGQVASAVAAAHSKGIVHRDLKPDNVFLSISRSTGGGPLTVKILDFGIAKLLAAEGEGRSKTRTGSLLGTPTYMSPEQCRGAGTVDHRSDIYSLGCMVFEMVAGRPPFVRNGEGEVLVAHLVETPPPLSSLVPGLPADLDALVAQMLEKDAAARPQSMQEIVTRVESLLGVRPAQFAAAMQAPQGFPTAEVVGATTRGGATPPVGVITGVGSAAAPALGPAGTVPLPITTPVPRSGPVVGGSGPVVAGGTRVLPGPSRTTLSDSASEAGIDDAGLPPPSPRPRWLIPAAAGGGAVVVIVAAIALLHSPSPPPPPPHAVLQPPPPVEPPPPPPVKPPEPPPPPAEVAIEVTSDPAGAEVWLPGEDSARGHTPLKIAVRRGQPAARVTLKAPGYADTTLSLDADRGGEPVSVALEKLKRERHHGGGGAGAGEGKPAVAHDNKPPAQHGADHKHDSPSGYKAMGD